MSDFDARQLFDIEPAGQKPSSAKDRENGFIRPYHYELTWLTRGTDATCIWTALFLAVVIHTGEWHRGHILLGSIATLFYFFTAERAGLYQSWRSYPLRDEIFSITLAWGSVVLGMLLLGYATKTTHVYSRVEVGLWSVGTFGLLSGWRSMLRLALRKSRAVGYNSRRVAIAGANQLASQMVQTVNNAPWMGLNFVGYFDDRQVIREEMNADNHLVSGDFADLIAAAESGSIDVIYVALPVTAQQRMIDLISRLSNSTASVYVIPDFLMSQLFQGGWVHIGDMPVVRVFETPFYGVNGWIKRAEDLLLVALLLPLILLPMLLISVAIKCTSKGPVIFKQRRYGLDGQPFFIHKFRTMNVSEDDGQIIQAKRDDVRVTGIGAILRKTSMDELPQFIDVLRGDMSVVGPRPHAVAHNEYYRGVIRGYMLRHKVKPGITGWAQINGLRGETAENDQMAARVDHDMWYIRNWSPWIDLRIVVATAWHLLRGNDVY